MSTFLERQEVRRDVAWSKIVRRVERISLSVMIILAGLAALYGLYVLVFLGPYFSVKDIVVSGHWKRLNAASLVEISGVKQGQNLFLLDVGGTHERLIMHPWVREAAVRRYLPHTLRIFVEEHEPYAIFVEPDGMNYVDRSGSIFKRVDPEDMADYPLITGVVREGAPLGLAEEEKIRLISDAISIIDEFRKTEWGMKYGIAEVHFDPTRGFSVITERRPLEILLGDGKTTARIRRLDKLASAIRENNRSVQYILANEPGRVVVKYRT